jgi:hypothetical protein
MPERRQAVSCVGNNIIIQAINLATGTAERSGTAFRIMWMDSSHRRNTAFCDGIDKCLESIRTIIEDRQKETCQKS